MEQTVTFPGGEPPAWLTVQGLLAERGYPVQLRMIDGQLSFPDEVPPDAWHELRLGTPQGMVTVRREPGRVLLVTWGNADAALRQAWHAMTWAFAAAGSGQVTGPSGPQTADEFLRAADLRPPT